MGEKNIRLVLLPAFDGTGFLFSDLITQLGEHLECLPIAYPQTGSQDYDTLAGYVRQQIPGDAPYILLGESFAGPLVYRLATQDTKRCQTAIFVATYLTNPSPLLLKVLTLLPAAILSLFVSNAWVIKKLTLSRHSDNRIARTIAKSYGSVEPLAIKARLKTISQIQSAPTVPISIPCYYLLATEDKLVRPRQIPDFQTLCQTLDIRAAHGGHFVLQENPMATAQIIKHWLLSR